MTRHFLCKSSWVVCSKFMRLLQVVIYVSLVQHGYMQGSTPTGLPFCATLVHSCVQFRLDKLRTHIAYTQCSNSYIREVSLGGSRMHCIRFSHKTTRTSALQTNAFSVHQQIGRYIVRTYVSVLCFPSIPLCKINVHHQDRL